MGILAQGSQLFMIDPATGLVTEIECITNFNPGGNPADKLDDTCLANTTRRTKKGLRTPGQATMALKPDPANASHVRAFELSESDDEADQDIHFVLGWSDGTTLPTSLTSGPVDTATVTAAGTGYATAPAVGFTGGGGTGATAVATVAGGLVTGITITNGGSGYTSAPTIGLTGGGGTGATATAAVDLEADFVLPASRTWFKFDGYFDDFPMDFGSAALVDGSATVQRNGPAQWIVKTP